MSMKIVALLGSESHTTSSKSASMTINGKPATYRSALSSDWQTKFGDKHAKWCECVFEVNDGDVIEFKAAHNYGPRACNRDRTDIELRFDLSVDVVDIGVVAGSLKGRLVLVSDRLAAAASAHEAAILDL